MNTTKLLGVAAGFNSSLGRRWFLLQTAIPTCIGPEAEREIGAVNKAITASRAPNRAEEHATGSDGAEICNNQRDEKDGRKTALL